MIVTTCMTYAAWQSRVALLQPVLIIYSWNEDTGAFAVHALLESVDVSFQFLSASKPETFDTDFSAAVRVCDIQVT